MDPDYTRILEEIMSTLRKNPRGMTIIELANSLDINRNTMAKYLDVLQIGGNVNSYKIGPAKIYTVSNRVPVQALLNLHDNGILLIDSSLHIISVNETFCEIVNLNRSDILGEHVEGWVHFYENSHDIYNAFQLAVSGLPTEMNVDVVSHDQKRHVCCKFVPTTFDDGSTGATLIVVDETEKHIRQEQIVKSEKQYRTLVENIQDGIYILQGEAIVFCNTALSRIFQMTTAEVIGSSIWDFVHPEELEWITTEYFRLLAGLESIDEFDIRLIRKDGNTVYARSKTSVIEYNGEVAILGIIRDMTNQIDLKTMHIMSHETILDILDSLEIPIYVVDSRSHEILYANQKVIELVGEVSGKVCWKVFHENSEGPCSACAHSNKSDNIQKENFSNIEGCSKEFSKMGGKEYRFYTKRILWKDFRISRITVGYEN